MTRRVLTFLGMAGSAGLLLGALGFQYLGDMPPCKLCYWQRYGHVGALLFGLAALALSRAQLLWLAAAAAGSSAVIGAYHTGVERKWWEGPTSCSAQSIEGLSPDELMKQIMEAPLVRCDEVPWEMFGLSMASWNLAASAVIAALFIAAARARR